MVAARDFSKGVTVAVSGPRRSEQLRLIIDHDRPVFDAKPGLPPGGRAECRNGPRPCVYVRCGWHMWRQDPEHKQGRPWWKSPPDNARKETYERQTKLELRPAWLKPANAPDGLSVANIVKFYSRPSCGLDLIEAAAGNPVPCTEIALGYGKHPSLIRREVKTALHKVEAGGATEEGIRAAMGEKR